MALRRLPEDEAQRLVNAEHQRQPVREVPVDPSIGPLAPPPEGLGRNPAQDDRRLAVAHPPPGRNGADRPLHGPNLGHAVAARLDGRARRALFDERLHGCSRPSVGVVDATVPEAQVLLPSLRCSRPSVGVVDATRGDQRRPGQLGRCSRPSVGVVDATHLPEPSESTRFFSAFARTIRSRANLAPFSSAGKRHGANQRYASRPWPLREGSPAAATGRARPSCIVAALRGMPAASFRPCSRRGRHAHANRQALRRKSCSGRGA